MVNTSQITSNTRTRTLLIMVGIMILGGVSVAIYSFSKSNKNPKSISPTSGVPTNIRVTPGAKSSEKYVELQQAANMLGTKKAEAKGKTFMPTIIGNKTEDSSKNLACQLSGIIDEQDKNSINRLSKQLASLLADLMKQGGSTDDLLHLMQELQHQGYNIADLDELAKRLQADGYNTDELAKLLEKLKNQGYSIDDTQRMLQKMLQDGNGNPDLINKIIEQLVKDKLQALDEVNNQLRNNSLNPDQLPDMLRKTNNPDLTNLLDQLSNQGYQADTLDNLSKQLMSRGYDVNNPEKLLKQLAKDGYDVKNLQDLLNQQKSAGKDVSSLKNLLQALFKKSNNKFSTNEQDKQPLNASDQLTNIFNNPATTGKHLSNIDKEYAALLKKQQDAAIEEEKNRKLAEQHSLNEEKISLNSEAQQKALATLLATMQAQVDPIADKLGKIPTQTFVLGDLSAGKEDDSKGSSKENNQGSKIKQQLLANNSLLNNNDLIIKSGSILFAILETSINSDEPSPILARIVQDPLKNTKLIGTIQANNNPYSEKLVLSFSTANIPDKIRSYGISAIAIDPNTARTAIASEVDHHYLLRWGTILAATFLQGYSKAVAESGTTLNTTNTGAMSTSTTTKSPLNPRQQIYQGIGDMVTAWGQGVKQYTNRPPTIYVHSGTSVGILLTADFTVPSSDDVPNELPQPLKGASLQVGRPLEQTSKTIQEPADTQVVSNKDNNIVVDQTQTNNQNTVNDTTKK